MRGKGELRVGFGAASAVMGLLILGLVVFRMVPADSDACPSVVPDSELTPRQTAVGRTWWPVGVPCIYAFADGSRSTIEPNWGPTMMGIAGLVLLLVGGILVLTRILSRVARA